MPSGRPASKGIKEAWEGALEWKVWVANASERGTNEVLKEKGVYDDIVDSVTRQ